MTNKKNMLRNYAQTVALYECAKITDKHTLSDAIMKADKDLNKAGARIVRASYYGKDGLALYENGFGKLYAVLPKTVNLTKKPRIVIYELNDIVAADILSKDLCNAKTYADVLAIERNAQARVKAPSLLNDLMEGIEHVANELKNTYEEEPKETPMNQWQDCVITQKNEKSCIWVSGNTKPHKEELKAAGYRWSKKRKAWYLKPLAA